MRACSVLEFNTQLRHIDINVRKSMERNSIEIFDLVRILFYAPKTNPFSGNMSIGGFHGMLEQSLLLI